MKNNFLLSNLFLALTLSMSNISYVMKTKQILKTALLAFTSLIMVISCNKNDDGGSNTPITEKGFITTWKTTVANEEISIKTFPTNFITTPYNYTVDWGDGNVDSNVTESITHGYTTAGIHTVTITGDFPGIYNHEDSSNAAKLLTIESWGDNIVWESMRKAFYQCENLTGINATDTPNLSYVTDMSYMFSFAINFNSDISNWDVSNVTDMSLMFYNATSFNSDISNWDVSKVTSMDYMFYDATNFNRDISDWDVGNVTSIGQMFSGATNFNSNISNWDVSKVTYMSGMFKGATNFNSNISNWDVSNVTELSSMFEDATSFNQDLSGWATINVTSCSNFSAGSSGLEDTNLPTAGTCF